MVTAKITSKGQITIPKSIRDSLHLSAGDRVAFELNSPEEATFRPITKSVDDAYGMLKKPGQKAISVKQMHEAVVENMRKRHS